MTEQKLLSCPFCGGEAFIYYSGSQFQFGEVVCKECESHSDRKRVDEAVESWNTRVPMQKIVERLEYINKTTFDLAKLNWSEYQVGVLNGVASSINKSLEIIKEDGGLND